MFSSLFDRSIFDPPADNEEEVTLPDGRIAIKRGILLYDKSTGALIGPQPVKGAISQDAPSVTKFIENSAFFPHSKQELADALEYGVRTTGSALAESVLPTMEAQFGSLNPMLTPEQIARKDQDNPLRPWITEQNKKAEGALGNDPSLAAKLVGQIPQQAAQYAATAVAPPLGIALMNQQVLGSGIGKAIAEGKSSDEAALPNILSAAAQTPLEYWGVENALHGFSTGKGISGLFKQAVKSGVTEGGTEGLQSYPETLKDLYLGSYDKKNGEVDYDRLLADLNPFGKNVGEQVLFGAVLGSGANVAVNTREAALRPFGLAHDAVVVDSEGKMDVVTPHWARSHGVEFVSLDAMDASNGVLATKDRLNLTIKTGTADQQMAALNDFEDATKEFNSIVGKDLADPMKRAPTLDLHASTVSRANQTETFEPEQIKRFRDMAALRDIPAGMQLNPDTKIPMLLEAAASVPGNEEALQKMAQASQLYSGAVGHLFSVYDQAYAKATEDFNARMDRGEVQEYQRLGEVKAALDQHENPLVAEISRQTKSGDLADSMGIIDATARRHILHGTEEDATRFYESIGISTQPDRLESAQGSGKGPTWVRQTQSAAQLGYRDFKGYKTALLGTLTDEKIASVMQPWTADLFKADRSGIKTIDISDEGGRDLNPRLKELISAVESSGVDKKDTGAVLDVLGGLLRDSANSRGQITTRDAIAALTYYAHGKQPLIRTNSSNGTRLEYPQLSYETFKSNVRKFIKDAPDTENGRFLANGIARLFGLGHYDPSIGVDDKQFYNANRNRANKKIRSTAKSLRMIGRGYQGLTDISEALERGTFEYGSKGDEFNPTISIGQGVGPDSTYTRSAAEKSKEEIGNLDHITRAFRSEANDAEDMDAIVALFTGDLDTANKAGSIERLLNKHGMTLGYKSDTVLTLGRRLRSSASPEAFYALARQSGADHDTASDFAKMLDGMLASTTGDVTYNRVFHTLQTLRDIEIPESGLSTARNVMGIRQNAGSQTSTEGFSLYIRDREYAANPNDTPGEATAEGNVEDNRSRLTTLLHEVVHAIHGPKIGDNPRLPGLTADETARVYAFVGSDVEQLASLYEVTLEWLKNKSMTPDGRNDLAMYVTGNPSAIDRVLRVANFYNNPLTEITGVDQRAMLSSLAQDQNSNIPYLIARSLASSPKNERAIDAFSDYSRLLDVEQKMRMGHELSDEEIAAAIDTFDSTQGSDDNLISIANGSLKAYQDSIKDKQRAIDPIRSDITQYAQTVGNELIGRFSKMIYRPGANTYSVPEFYVATNIDKTLSQLYNDALVELGIQSLSPDGSDVPVPNVMKVVSEFVGKKVQAAMGQDPSAVKYLSDMGDKVSLGTFTGQIPGYQAPSGPASPTYSEQTGPTPGEQLNIDDPLDMDAQIFDDINEGVDKEPPEEKRRPGRKPPAMGIPAETTDRGFFGRFRDWAVGYGILPRLKWGESAYDRTGAARGIVWTKNNVGKREFRFGSNTVLAGRSFIAGPARDLVMKYLPKELEKASFLVKEWSHKADMLSQDFMDATYAYARANNPGMSGNDIERIVTDLRAKTFQARLDNNYRGVPKEIQPQAKALFGVVEELTQKLIDSKLLSKEAAEQYRSDLGIYLHRDYRAFHVKDWAALILQDEKAYSAAYDRMLEVGYQMGYDKKGAAEFADGQIRRMIRDRISPGELLGQRGGGAKVYPNLDRSELKTRAGHMAEEWYAFKGLDENKDATDVPQLFQRFLDTKRADIANTENTPLQNRYLLRQIARMERNYTKMRTKLRNLTDTQVIRRVLDEEDMPDAFRKIMGEIKDPVIAVKLSVAHMAHDIEYSQFWRDLRQLGLDNGVFVTKPQGALHYEINAGNTTTNQRMDVQTLIGEHETADGLAKTQKVTDGTPLYTTREVMELLNAVYENNKTNTFATVIGLMKYGKVLSPAPLMRNWMSVPFMTGMNGHWGTQLLKLMVAADEMGSDFKAANRARKGEIYSGVDLQGMAGDYTRARTRGERQDKTLIEGQTSAWWIEQAIKRGVLVPGIGKELEIQIADAAMRIRGSDLTQIGEAMDQYRTATGQKKEALRRKISAFTQLAGNVYNSPDVASKMFAFVNEVRTLRWYHSDSVFRMAGVTESILDEAANTVNDTYQTYDRLPQWIREYSKLGSFAGFQVEMIRNIGNMIYEVGKWGGRAIRTEGGEGYDARGRGKALAIAANRASGLILFTLMLRYLEKWGSEWFGTAQDKVHSFMRAASYKGNENVTPVVTKREGTKWTYFDTSNQNPYQLTDRLLNIIMNPQLDYAAKGKEMASTFQQTILPPLIPYKIIAELYSGTNVNPDWSKGRGYEELGTRLHIPGVNLDPDTESRLYRLYRNVAPGVVGDFAEGGIRTLSNVSKETTGQGLFLRGQVGSRVYDMEDYLMNQLLGWQSKSVDITVPLATKSSEFRDARLKISTMLNKDLRDLGATDYKGKLDRIKKAEESWNTIYAKYVSDIQDFMNMGVPISTIKENLKKAQLDERSRRKAMLGMPIRWQDIWSEKEYD